MFHTSRLPGVAVSPPDFEKINEFLETVSGLNFHLYAFILYGNVEIHKDFSDFLNKKGGWLDSLSGEDCLIITFESPKNWGSRWADSWKKKLGDEQYAEYSREWNKLDESYRDLSYEVALKFGIDVKDFPCIIFSEDFVKNIDNDEVLVISIPKVKNTKEYELFFEDLFNNIREVARKEFGECDVIPKLKKKLDHSINRWKTKILLLKLGDSIRNIAMSLAPVFPSLVKLF